MTWRFGSNGFFHRRSTERIVECRDCGTSLESDAETCPARDSRGIAHHEL